MVNLWPVLVLHDIWQQEIIVSATSDPIVEEAWDKVVDTIKAIEKEYPTTPGEV
jgi:hypothetical protein